MKTNQLVAFLVLFGAASVIADSFGTGVNQFDLTFQTISSDSNPTDGCGLVNYDYRIGTYEITTDQWNKYNSATSAAAGLATTSTGSQAVNNVSWNEAAQFVNWLNTSIGYQAAYNFDESGSLVMWDDVYQSDTSAYRNKDAIYVLPSEDEWVKAAYWNGSSLQTYSTPNNALTDVDVNYGGSSNRTVGEGSEEVNGTFDMMGNVWEWNENADATTADSHVVRGGSYNSAANVLSEVTSGNALTTHEGNDLGFRVAAVPEPTSITLIGFSGACALALRRFSRR